VNYYEHHLGDYLRDAAHLPFVEEAAYRRLLDAYYIREGPLPADHAACELLARARSKAERTAVGSILSAFFDLRPDGYHQRRADREIARYLDKRAKAIANSALGVAARAGRKTGRPTKPQPNGIPTGQPDGIPHQTPDTIHHSEAKASGGSSPPEPVDLIFGLGLPALLAASVPEKNARTMLGLMRKTHGDDAVVAAVQRMAEERPLEPVAWLQSKLKSGPPKNKAVALSYRERDAELAIAEAEKWGGGRVAARRVVPLETIEMEPSHGRLDHG
jgi:uncharacterized protein YdaU (DUF1376 family)